MRGGFAPAAVPPHHGLVALGNSPSPSEPLKESGGGIGEFEFGSRMERRFGPSPPSRGILTSPHARHRYELSSIGRSADPPLQESRLPGHLHRAAHPFGRLRDTPLGGYPHRLADQVVERRR